MGFGKCHAVQEYETNNDINFVRVVCLWKGSLYSLSLSLSLSLSFFIYLLETQADHLKDVHFSGLIYPLCLLPYIYLGRDAITL